jgi:hypothetical protein
MRVVCLIGITKMPVFKGLTNLILLCMLSVMANLIFGKHIITKSA